MAALNGLYVARMPVPESPAEDGAKAATDERVKMSFCLLHLSKTVCVLYRYHIIVELRALKSPLKLQCTHRVQSSHCSKNYYRQILESFTVIYDKVSVAADCWCKSHRQPLMVTVVNAINHFCL